jgi:hypothetical protein
MSYASVIGQQMVTLSQIYLDDAASAGILDTIFTETLVGKYIYNVIFTIDSSAVVTSSEIRCGSTHLIENPNTKVFARTCTGIATGLFEIKLKMKEDVNYIAEVSLLKLV